VQSVAARQNPAMSEANAPAIQYIGHGTVLVAMDGARVLTDPLLRLRVAHLRRAGTATAEIPHDLDAVLISHLLRPSRLGSLPGPGGRSRHRRGGGALLRGKGRRAT
jgi:hypothetical protein